MNEKKVSEIFSICVECYFTAKSRSTDPSVTVFCRNIARGIKCNIDKHVDFHCIPFVRVAPSINAPTQRVEHDNPRLIVQG